MALFEKWWGCVLLVEHGRMKIPYILSPHGTILRLRMSDKKSRLGHDVGWDIVAKYTPAGDPEGNATDGIDYMRTYKVYYQDREYAASVGDPLLSIVRAITRDKALDEANSRSIGERGCPLMVVEYSEQPPPPPVWLTTTQVASLCGVSPAAVRRAIHKKKLNAKLLTEPRRQWLVAKEDAENWRR